MKKEKNTKKIFFTLSFLFLLMSFSVSFAATNFDAQEMIQQLQSSNSLTDNEIAELDNYVDFLFSVESNDKNIPVYKYGEKVTLKNGKTYTSTAAGRGQITTQTFKDTVDFIKSKYNLDLDAGPVYGTSSWDKDTEAGIIKYDQDEQKFITMALIQMKLLYKKSNLKELVTKDKYDDFHHDLWHTRWDTVPESHLERYKNKKEEYHIPGVYSKDESKLTETTETITVADDKNINDFFSENSITEDTKNTKQSDLEKFADSIMNTIQSDYYGSGDKKTVSDEYHKYLILSNLRTIINKYGYDIHNLTTRDDFKAVAKLFCKEGYYSDSYSNSDCEDVVEREIEKVFAGYQYGEEKEATTTTDTVVSSGGTNNKEVSDKYEKAIQSTTEEGLVSEKEGLSGVFDTIGRVVKFMTKLGFMAVSVAILWAGVLLLKSGGDTSARTKAKEILIKAFIGLFFIAAAYSLVWYMTEMFLSDSAISSNPLLQMIKE